MKLSEILDSLVNFQLISRDPAKFVIYLNREPGDLAMQVTISYFDADNKPAHFSPYVFTGADLLSTDWEIIN